MPTVADNPARVRDIADAIALELNATLAVVNESDQSAIAPARFVAARNYGQDYANADLKTLHVDVRPPGWTLDAESRGGSDDHYQLEIAVQQLITLSDQSTIDLLFDLTAHIARYFCPKRILGAYGNVAAGTVEVVETPPPLLYAPDKLRQGRYFGLVTLTLQEFVAR